MSSAAGLPTGIARHWSERDAVSLLLFPVSLVFRLLVALRRGAFRLGLLRSTRLPVPVIVVGNITVGGSGKTPLVIALAAALASRGHHPGIISRGYGGRTTLPREVRADDDPTQSGDEPLLLARKSGCPVWTGRDRGAAGAALLAAHPDCDLLLLDDGLQHYALARDFEVAVEDARGYGNGFMLPAGPLREPVGRKVDARVINVGHSAQQSGAAFGAHEGACFAMQLQTRRLYRLDQPARDVAPASLAGLRLHAVAGIGNPARFFAQLAAAGLAFVPHAFADHHAYSEGDLRFADCDAVLMTEKDAVKCERFGRTDLYALAADADIDPALIELMLKRLHGRTPV
jgi:tetraacyldisaccharide 4'-kinase